MNGAPEYKRLELTTLADGAAVELFDRDLKQVLDNIQDPNTNPETARTITITVTLKPGKARDVAKISVDCKAKLAPCEAQESTAWFQQEGGKLKAYEHTGRQGSLFSDDNVRPMKGKE